MRTFISQSDLDTAVLHVEEADVANNRRRARAWEGIVVAEASSGVVVDWHKRHLLPVRECARAQAEQLNARRHADINLVCAYR